MSDDPTVDPGTAPAGGEPMAPGVESSWRSLEVGGAILAILGVLAILFPFATGVSISVILGALLVVGALVHVAHAFRARGWRGFVGQALLAIVYAIAGISLLANPVVGLTSLTLLLVAYFFVSGIVEVVMGFQVRGEPGWAGLVGSGAIAVALAALLWVGFPGTAAWALGLLLGVNLLTTGISMLWVGRGAHKEATSEEPDRAAA